MKSVHLQPSCELIPFVKTSCLESLSAAITCRLLILTVEKILYVIVNNFELLDFGKCYFIFTSNMFVS